ncbi:NAD(P)H-dependent oxidoreductase [Furfurilactobacillus rossiae]|uniref:flavodoxin n=1 Tax=Furfurilactobacillus rossiae TaxID=231049 RepID=UPI001F3FA441|nr:flavodoxin [Furfurilactobacillus rossiae]MCF6166683.1 NAD(P)H-dependent oxidoreductase [Furfurilactobacillus rossiae]
MAGLLILIAGMMGWHIQRWQATRQLGQNQSSQLFANTKKSSTVKKSNKVDPKRILIVTFSRVGTNYPDVTLKVGHTQHIANQIAQVTHGRQFSIQADDMYPKNYQATVDRAEREQDRNARPEIKGPLPDMANYDVIFLGYPIWWNEIPMPVRTFMDEENLNGKVIIPFSTNAGSGWGDSLSQLRQKYPHATLRGGYEVEGTRVNHSTHAINKWLHELGF